MLAVIVFTLFIVSASTYKISFTPILFNELNSTMSKFTFFVQIIVNDTHSARIAEETLNNNETEGLHFLLDQRSLLYILISDEICTQSAGLSYVCTYDNEDKICELLLMIDGEMMTIGNFSLSDMMISWTTENVTYKKYVTEHLSLSNFASFFEHWVEKTYNISTRPLNELEVRTKLENRLSETVLRCTIWKIREDINVSFLVNDVIINANCSTLGFGFDVVYSCQALLLYNVITASCVCTFRDGQVKLWNISNNGHTKHFGKRAVSYNAFNTSLIQEPVTPPVIHAPTISNKIAITSTTSDITVTTKRKRSRRHSVGIVAAVIFILAVIGIFLVISKYGCPCRNVRRSQIALLIEARRNIRFP